MPKRLLAVTAALALCALSAEAKDPINFVYYSIKTKTPKVEGILIPDGYSYAQIQSFIRADCASGRLGDFALVGKPRKKRGHLLQKFVTSCEGGPHPRFQGTRAVSIEVERTPEGRNMAEYTYGVSGNIQYERAFK